jgi:hypothetical protein
MKLNNMKSGNLKVFLAFCVMTLIFFLKYLLIGVFSSSITENRELTTFEKIAAFAFMFNTCSYEFFNHSYLLSIYLVNLRLSGVVDFIKSTRNKDPATKLRNLKTCSFLVGKLCDVQELTKFYFTINTFSTITHFLYFTIITFYSVISTLFRKTQSKYDAAYALISISWNISYLPFFVCTFVISNSIKKVKENIQKGIFENFKQNPYDLKIQKRIQLIFLQLHHQYPINSCGFFVIDYYLLFHLFTMFISYLIIIIQFEWITFDN